MAINKETHTAVTVICPNDLFEKLTEDAEKNSRSMSSEFVFTAQEYLSTKDIKGIGADEFTDDVIRLFTEKFEEIYKEKMKQAQKAGREAAKKKKDDC